MTPKELKSSILQLAIEGKLVEQRKEEGSAETLYAEIQKEKQKLIKQGKIKKEKELPEITDDEIPFEIPKSWKWVRLGAISQFLGGFAFKKENYVKQSNNQIVRLGNVKMNNLALERAPIYISDKDATKCIDYKILKDDLLITMTGTRKKGDYLYTLIVKSNDIKNVNLYLNQRVGCFRFSSCLYVKYICLVMQNELLRKIVLQYETGTANQGNIGSTELKEKYYIPLPPIEEQKRIVEKIEELMPLVDRYEVLYDKLNVLNKEFPKKLKNAVLQKAIEGKLVPQIKSEGSAEDLYVEIQKEKQKLIKQGKIKKEKELPEITDDEIPFEIPKSWKWCRIKEIVYFQQGIQIDLSKQKFEKFANSVRFLRIINFTQDNTDYRYIDKKYSNDAVYINNSKLVMVRYGATSGNIYYGQEGVLANNLFSINTYINKTLNSYLKLFFENSVIKSFIVGDKSDTAMPSINFTTMNKLIFPLPPLAEQKRIVEKIEEIMPNIEKLEKNII